MARETGRANIESTRDQPTATRRRGFLRSATAAGFAASTATLLAGGANATTPGETSVVVGYEHAPDDPATVEAHRKRVPADWYDDYRRAGRALYAHGRGLLESSGVKNVALEPGEYGGRNARLNVDVDPREDADAPGSIPERVDGVPVDVRETGGYELACADITYNTGHYPDDTPGSIQVCGGTYSGTLTGRVWHPDDYQEYFLVCNHLYGDDGTAHAGEPLYQPDESYPALGAVEEGFCYVDAMLVDPRNGHDPIPRIEDVYPSEKLTGWFTRDGLSDLKADGEPIQKYGCRTATTIGQIESTDGWTSYYGCTPKVGQLQWGDNEDLDDGDSGSLAVNAPPDGSGGYADDAIWACGMCNARTADWASGGANYVWGTSAWKLNNKFGWRF